MDAAVPEVAAGSRRDHEDPDGEWAKLPAPPLSGRVDSLVAAVSDRVIVAGGWDFLCPPGADCATPTAPPHTDGAAYDLKVGEWTDISDAPVGFRSVSAVVVGEDVYALVQCESGPTCPSGKALLRYRSKADAWDRLPGPNAGGYYRLIQFADGFVAYSGSDEGGDGRDYRFFAGEDRWQELPDDPLPPVYDRFVVEYAGRLLLFGTPLEHAAKTKLAAAYDPETEDWQELAESGSQGYQVWRGGSLLYLNPHFGRGGGGIYDPSENVWRALPDPPYHDLAGVVGEDEATYEYASGWVIDARSGDWLNIGPRPDSSEAYDHVVAAGPDQRMVVFGGQTWKRGEGQLVHDTWLWTPPPATGSSP